MRGEAPPSEPDLVEAAGRLLVERGWFVGLAESCTGGLVMARLTDRAGSSAYFAGGVVAYADRIKTGQLSVPPTLLATRGAVSREAARAMAEGVRRRLAVEVGLAVTGIAGPGGAVPGKPVGTVWFGLSLPTRFLEEKVEFDGDRTRVRALAVEHALRLLVRVLEGEPPGPDQDRTQASSPGR